MHSERRTFHPPPSCLAGLASNERGKREKKFSTIKSTKLNEAGGGWRGRREERSRRSGKVQRNDNSNNNNKKKAKQVGDSEPV